MRFRFGPVAPRSRRAVRAAALAALLLGPLAAPAARAVTARAQIDDGLVAALGDDHRLLLEARPQEREGLLAFSRRLCGDDGVAATIAGENGGAKRLLAGIRYRVPYELLTPELKRKVVAALFPGDAPVADGWRHTVRGAGGLGRESLWYLAVWFTGDGENFRAIREYNDLVEEDVAAGKTVTVPAELLLPAFRAALPTASVLDRPALNSPTAADFGLEYGHDGQGDYAAYRLRPGEALYSSVVVRFTGHLTAADVNSLAADVAARNGIPDVRDIPVGYRVKIPLDLLLPEFLPEGDPRRREYEAGVAASSRFSNHVQARGLEGITVMLDPGHGGCDVGASVDGVWESAYVYDVALRARRLLAEHTAAHVMLTTRDGDDYAVPDRDVLPFSRGHEVLTHPPYPIEDSRTGVHLRWYLANSVYHHALAENGDPEKTVFISIHADSLHPSIRGATIYIPGADMTGGTFGKHGAVFEARREYRDGPNVSFPYGERVKSEGLSRELAKKIVAEMSDRDLALHPTKPIREKIIRQRSAWVPAVLRYNAVPAKVLVEIANLANREDRRLIQTRAFRERVAEAIVQGILDYYDTDDAKAPPVQVAATK
jgi:N-acetylmuramoyl-L-alanine amidase